MLLIECVRKVAVHFLVKLHRLICQYRSCRWSVLLFHCIQLLNSGWSAIQVKCVIVSFGFYSLWFLNITSNIFYKCTATFRTHCIIHACRIPFPLLLRLIIYRHEYVTWNTLFPASCYFTLFLNISQYTLLIPSRYFHIQHLWILKAYSSDIAPMSQVTASAMLPSVSVGTYVSYGIGTFSPVA
jgi:hypothetical protein